MTKVQSKDIKNTAFLTTGTAPDFVVTIPREETLAGMDRMKFTVNFHSAGSGTITLNVNGFGAKTVEGVSSVASDEYMTVIYDLSQDKFLVESRSTDINILSGFDIVAGTSNTVFSESGSGAHTNQLVDTKTVVASGEYSIRVSLDFCYSGFTLEINGTPVTGWSSSSFGLFGTHYDKDITLNNGDILELYTNQPACGNGTPTRAFQGTFDRDYSGFII